MKTDQATNVPEISIRSRTRRTIHQKWKVKYNNNNNNKIHGMCVCMCACEKWHMCQILRKTCQKMLTRTLNTV